MKNWLQIINQFVEIQQKAAQANQSEQFERNFNKIHYLLEQEGYIIKNPLGEQYNDTRTDCEVSIVGNESRHMIITQVIKPIIYKQDSDKVTLVQKGLVIIEKAK